MGLYCWEPCSGTRYRVTWAGTWVAWVAAPYRAAIQFENAGPDAIKGFTIRV